jgi:hypothetical protein
LNNANGNNYEITHFLSQKLSFTTNTQNRKIKEREEEGEDEEE